MYATEYVERGRERRFGKLANATIKPFAVLPSLPPSPAMEDPPAFDDFPPIDSDYLNSNPLSFSFDDLDFHLDDLLLLSPDSALSFPSPDSAADSSGSAPDHPPSTPGPKPSSSSSHNSGDAPAVSSIRLDDPVKSEANAAAVAPAGKRKMGGDGGDSGVRVVKLHRSSGGDGGDGGKKQARLMRNRESAQLSRQRKKHYVEELEERVRSLGTAVAELNGKLSYVVAENATLRQQLAAAITGVTVQPIYPPPLAAAVPIPWIPAPSPFVVKAQGSKVPLVPIPRIKPQQPASAPKAKRADGGKTKKVASVSLLGLLFFLLLFGGLVPIVNVRYGSITDLSRVEYGNAVFGSKLKGRVLAVKGPVDKCGGGGGEGDRKEPHWLRNASEPLSASLYVPRNDKLVKIDGNLIIHSILASEKAVANSKSSKTMSGRDSGRGNGWEKTGLAIPRSLGSALAVSASGVDVQKRPRHYRKHTEKLRAIGSGSGDRYNGQERSNAAEGPLQEWFREGLAGE